MENFGGRKSRGKKKIVEIVEKYDEEKFVSKEAASIYKMNRKKALITERGLDVSSQGVPKIRQIMEFYGWVQGNARRSLADKPEPVAMDLVHEFYANLKASSVPGSRIVIVRKKQVDFGPSRINEFYNLKVPDECWFENEIHSDVDWEALLGIIGRPGSSWVYARDGQPKEFKREALSKELRLLMNFLNAKVMPSSHHSSVSRDRALLLYGLIGHQPVDFGSLISHSILEAARGPGNRGYVMPSLITELCVDSGVLYGDDDIWEMPKEILDERFFLSMKKDADGGSSSGQEKTAPQQGDEYF